MVRESARLVVMVKGYCGLGNGDCFFIISGLGEVWSSGK